MADHSDDLDQLLDRALDDFQSLTFASSAQRGVENNGDRNEENKQECCTLNGGNVQGLGMGLPDLKIKKKGKTKMPPPKQESHITEALDKLREQTREAVKGLESVSGPRPLVAGDDSGGDAMTEDWVKQFEELAGSQDMESIVESMMQQLLSKEILHEPMKEIGERYPTWLEDNRAKLTAEEYSRYSRQYRLIKDLNQVYESEPENSTRLLSLCSKCKSVVNHQMILCKRLLQILIYQILDNCLQRCWSLNRIVVLCDVREKPWFYFSKGGFCHSIILPVKEIELVKLS